MCSRSRLAALDSRDSRPARPHRLQRATARQYRYSIFQEHGTQIACNSPKLPRRPSIPSNANPLHHVPEPPRILRLYCASSEFGGVRVGVTARIRNQYIGCDEGPSHDSEGDFGNDCPIQDILMNDGGVWFYDFRNEQEPEKK